jgi:hypothetical protein
MPQASNGVDVHSGVAAHDPFVWAVPEAVTVIPSLEVDDCEQAMRRPARCETQSIKVQ